MKTEDYSTQINTHFGVSFCEKVNRSSLTNSCRREIKRKERYLERKCGKIWWHKNNDSEAFLFANFNNDREDKIVVTLASYIPYVGWITSY